MRRVLTLKTAPWRLRHCFLDEPPKISDDSSTPAAWAGWNALVLGGMADDVSLTPLEALCLDATQDNYCDTHNYAVGDLFIWHTCSLLHSAAITDVKRPARTM